MMIKIFKDYKKIGIEGVDILDIDFSYKEIYNIMNLFDFNRLAIVIHDIELNNSLFSELDANNIIYNRLPSFDAIVFITMKNIEIFKKIISLKYEILIFNIKENIPINTYILQIKQIFNLRALMESVVDYEIDCSYRENFVRIIYNVRDNTSKYIFENIKKIFNVIEN